MIDLKTFVPRRILVCQLRQIGDVLLSTPALALLKRRYPDAAIDVVTEKKCLPVLENNPNVDHVWPIDKNILGNPIRALFYYARVGRANYDLVVDFQQLPRCKWVVRFSSAPVKLSFAPPWYNRYLYTHWSVPDDGYAAKCKTSVLKPLGIQWDGERPELFLTEQEREWAESFVAGLHLDGKRYVTVDPSHRRETRRWPIEHYARLMQLIREEKPDVSFIIMYGPGERELAEQVASRVGKGAVAPERMLSLREMAAVQEKAAMQLGNCSSPRHFAVAVDTPSLTIQGATGTAWRFPSEKHISAYKGLECQFCNRNECATRECLVSLLPEEVLPDALKLLSLSE
ncbi:glycosyltransferase family 9 protein [Pseudodesulfovibrio tunisiensis]|uniref:glycosyltransferase family 9 protein n=1 Tax=Pseudodesulfovibrio tunisiensis TaxID=463192 RepID=UPI001FB36C6A|nr:glycosyltransferase family 9 protein [Pseudodesulfovibrio tunisiensis]